MNGQNNTPRSLDGYSVGREDKMVNISGMFLPHVDEILGQCYGVRVARDSDGSVSAATLSLFAIRYPDHSSGYLSDLCDLGAALEMIFMLHIKYYKKCHILGFVSIYFLTFLSNNTVFTLYPFK